MMLPSDQDQFSYHQLLYKNMIRQLLEHNVRKDLRRGNKKHNHGEYLRALPPLSRVGYWAGYHKKKLIALVVLGAVSWTYDWHRSVYRYLLSLHSPQQFIHQLLTAEDKIPKTIVEQNAVWEFDPKGKELLQKLYYEADRRLIFGVSRNYLFQVYKTLGLLQKPEEERAFWINGGFYRKRNQLLSGVGLSEFLQLYEQAFNFLKKTQPQLSQQEYRKNFASLFVQKASQIQHWQKGFNKKRHGEYLKSLLTDNDAKQDEVCKLMREKLDISESEVELTLQEMGMKGLGVRDRWLYWTNRQILLTLREETLLRKLSFGMGSSSEERETRKRLQQLEKELQEAQSKKAEIKQLHLQLYEQELI